MNALEMIRLFPLMRMTSGRPEVIVGLIDGPVLIQNRLWSKNIVQWPTELHAACTRPSSAACMHGTLVASILSAKRGSRAPAICPGCTLLVQSIFPESSTGNDQMPSASPDQLAAAIVESVNAGARVLNMSLGLVQASTDGERRLQQALDYASERGAIPVAASGNQGTVGSSAITRHPWVLPVVGCDRHGRPTAESNLGNSIGRRGLRAPGAEITSLGPDGTLHSFRGTSVAAPFVTGAIALLWSEFPNASAREIKYAVTQGSTGRRATLVPPLLDAWAAYESLAARRAHTRA
jgi:subtilisin family serine protease